MQMVRTTISIPSDLHQELLLRSIREKKTLSNLVVSSLSKKNKTKKRKVSSIEEKLRKDFALFDKVAESGRKIDLLSALRKSRDERTKKLLKLSSL